MVRENLVSTITTTAASVFAAAGLVSDGGVQEPGFHQHPGVVVVSVAGRPPLVRDGVAREVQHPAEESVCSIPANVILVKLALLCLTHILLQMSADL